MAAHNTRAQPRHADGDGLICDVGAITHPDAVIVDALARLQLASTRLGVPVRLRHASPELRELLSLIGLEEVLPCLAESGLEVSGQAEEGEELLGVQEERDPADPAT